MRTFAIDLYLWPQDVEDWIFVPPASANLKWNCTFSRKGFLACEAGITFRVDDVLWLGNERDSFPFVNVLSDLVHSLEVSTKEKSLVNLRTNEFLALQVKQESEQIVKISRWDTRADTEDQLYALDRLAAYVGTCYKDFSIDRQLWNKAVVDTLNGLALAFSTTHDNQATYDDPFMNDINECLQKRYDVLVKLKLQ